MRNEYSQPTKFFGRCWLTYTKNSPTGILCAPKMQYIFAVREPIPKLPKFEAS